MENPLHGYSDEAFLAIVQEFRSSSDAEKVRCVLQHTVDGEGLLQPVVREIGGERYAFGFLVEREEAAQALARLLHQQLAQEKLAAHKKYIARRLEKCETPHEQKMLLKQIMQQSRAFIESAKDTPLYKGFNLAQLKQEQFLYSWQVIHLSDALHDESVFFSVVNSASEGDTAYQMEVYLAGILQHLQRSTEQSVLQNETLPIGNCELTGKKSTKKKEEQLTRRPKQEYELNYFFIEPIDKLFKEAEAQLAERVVAWRSGEDMIGCAGFCEAIFNKKWFSDTKPGTNSIIKNEVITIFACWRYGLNIANQLSSGKTKYRERKRKEVEKVLGWR